MESSNKRALGKEKRTTNKKSESVTVTIPTPDVDAYSLFPQFRQCSPRVCLEKRTSPDANISRGQFKLQVHRRMSCSEPFQIPYCSCLQYSAFSSGSSAMANACLHQYERAPCSASHTSHLHQNQELQVQQVFTHFHLTSLIICLNKHIWFLNQCIYLKIDQILITFLLYKIKEKIYFSPLN